MHYFQLAQVWTAMQYTVQMKVLRIHSWKKGGGGGRVVSPTRGQHQKSSAVFQTCLVERCFILESTSFESIFFNSVIVLPS